MEDKPRTDLGQAEDKQYLRRAAYRGKVQFYQRFNVQNLLYLFVLDDFRTYIWQQLELEEGGRRQDVNFTFSAILPGRSP